MPTHRAALRLPLLIACALLAAAVQASAETGPDEFVGPFSSWIDVKRADGAVGDGVADDSAALQRALDEVGRSGHGSVVYLPPGTYRITRTLQLAGRSAVAVIGDDPTTTTIRWAGPAGGQMHRSNGCSFASWGRLTWDGAGSARIGIGEQWDGTNDDGKSATTSTRFHDLIFRGLARGIVAGIVPPGWNDAEATVIRCRFEGMSEAGVSTESYNALDWFIADCAFTACARGVTDVFGGGNFSVYGCVFRDSSIADIDLGATQYFGIRDNVSSGAQQFVRGGGGGNAEQLHLQSNRVFGVRQAPAIALANMGPAILIDNQIATASGPVIAVGAAESGDLVTVGNRFTVAAVASLSGALQRRLDVDTAIVAASQISTAIPDPTPFPAKAARPVFEVASGGGSAALQAAIDRAAGVAGQHPVVHLAAGGYDLAAEVVVPAGLDLTIAGDSRATRIGWSGAAGGAMFRLRGPSRARFSDLWLDGGGRAEALRIENADQPGARVHGDLLWMAAATQHNLFADRLDRTLIDVLHCSHGYSDQASVYAVGGAQGAAGTSCVVLRGGASSTNSQAPMYDIRGGARMLVTDMWYEGHGAEWVHLSDAGSFTAAGAEIAPYPDAGGGASVVVDGLRGTAAFIGASAWFGRDMRVTGSSPEMNVLALGMQNDHGPGWFVDASTAGRVSLQASVHFADGAHPVANRGPADAGFIRDALSLLRTQRVPPLVAAGSGVTDVRLCTLNIEHATNGIHVVPDGDAPPADRVPPTVALTAPAPGAVSGMVTLMATANDDVGVAGVRFAVDGAVVADDADPPYAAVWDTAQAGAGAHTLTAIARDQAGNATTSAAIVVSVAHDAGDGGSAIPLVTAQRLGTLITGGVAQYWQGFAIDVGAQAMTVTALGRWATAGNAATHTLRLIDAATGADVPGGTTDVAMAGAPAGQYRYAALPAPVTLAANHPYWLLSFEIEGQDTYYDQDTVVTTTSAARIPQARLRTTDGVDLAYGGADHTWGPLNLLYRPSAGPSRAPHGGAPHAVPGVVEAEDFDDGGEGIAFHDSDPANQGGGYRASAVDIRASAAGGWQVGWFGPGEWLEYTVAVAAGGDYDLGLRVASGAAGATLRATIDGADPAGAIVFPGTGGWDTFTTPTRRVHLDAGTHVVRIACEAGALDLDRLSFTIPSPGIVSGGWYRVVAKHSGKLLAIAGSSPDEGAIAWQWADDGTAGEQWRLDAGGDGAWRLTARCSGKVLAVAGGSVDNGAPLIQATDFGGAEQRWRIEDQGDGWYRLVATQSGDVLDVSGLGQDNGTRVIQWPDWGGDNQRWALEPVPASSLAAQGRSPTPLARR